MRRTTVYIDGFNLYYSTLKGTSYKGQFSSHVVMKKLHPPINGQRHATVLETKEKGSDVNLAVHLINDAWLDRFDCAVVISGDSDLAESMRLVKAHHPKKILGLLTSKRGTSKEMVKCADFTRLISTRALVNSQMPDPVVPADGNAITKPVDW